MNASELDEQALSKELATMENYLKLENLRYPFQYRIELDPSLPLSEINVPPLLMQPLVENAIKHGVAGMGTMGKIIFSIKKRGKDILIAVNDNGKGFTMEEVSATKGLGLALTKERIKLLNSILKGRSIKLQIGKNQDKGQYIEIELKNWMI
jgi:LytS/YehU family sensor histidine kinase